MMKKAHTQARINDFHTKKFCCTLSINQNEMDTKDIQNKIEFLLLVIIGPAYFSSVFSFISLRNEIPSDNNYISILMQQFLNAFTFYHNYRQNYCIKLKLNITVEQTAWNTKWLELLVLRTCFVKHRTLLKKGIKLSILYWN